MAFRAANSWFDFLGFAQVFGVAISPALIIYNGSDLASDRGWAREHVTSACHDACDGNTERTSSTELSSVP